MRDISAIAFDAYGTLFDVHSVRTTAEAAFPGHGERISELWRAKQLEYTWLRSLMDRYEPFSSVTESALVFTLKMLGLEPAEDVVRRLLDAYLHLDVFAEVPEALAALRPRPLYIFSNGDAAMLDPLVRHCGLDALIDGVVSVDPARVYKPSPRSYSLVPEAVGVPTEQILFVSSNSFDVMGAKSFGFPVAWIQRTRRVLDELGFEPDVEVRLLTDLPRVLAD